MKKYISPMFLFMAALFWGISFPIQKWIADMDLPLFPYYATRSLIGVLFLMGAAMAFDHFSKNGRHLFGHGKFLDITKEEWIGGVVCGAFLIVASLLQQYGMVGDTDSGKSGFITALYSVFVPILGLALGKKPKKQIWICLPVAVAGFYFLCVKTGFVVTTSDLITLLCALMFAFQIMAIDRFVERCDPIRLSMVQFFFSGMLAVVLALLCRQSFSTVIFAPDGNVSGGIIWRILYLGIMSSGVAYTSQMLGQKGTDPSVASLLLCLESVFAVISGAILLGETMQGREIVGCILVFLAVASAQLDFQDVKDKLKNKKNAQKGALPKDN